MCVMSMYFFSMCLCMHVEFAYMFVCMQRSEIDVGNPSWSLLDLIHWVKVSQSYPGLADMATFLTSLLWDLLSFFQGWNYCRPPIQSGIYVGFWDLNSGPYFPAFDWYFDFLIVNAEDTILHEHVAVVSWRPACFWRGKGGGVHLRGGGARRSAGRGNCGQNIR